MPMHGMKKKSKMMNRGGATKKKSKMMARGGMKKTKYMAKGGMKKTKYMAGVEQQDVSNVLPYK